jgi:hypothetical protein
VVINLGLTLYVFGVIQHVVSVVSALQSAFG